MCLRCRLYSSTSNSKLFWGCNLHIFESSNLGMDRSWLVLENSLGIKPSQTSKGNHSLYAITWSFESIGFIYLPPRHCCRGCYLTWGVEIQILVLGVKIFYPKLVLLIEPKLSFRLFVFVQLITRT